MIFILYNDIVFFDIAITLHEYLTSEKYACELIVNYDGTQRDSDLYIIFGLNRYIEGQTLPNNYIVYQLEQTNRSDWFTSGYINRLKGAIEVWDYSTLNVRNLKDMFDVSAKFVPILPYDTGYTDNQTPTMLQSNNLTLFLGALNDRRQNILDKLESLDDNIHLNVGKYNLWGKERDEQIRKSLICINIHFYNDAILETTRLVHMLSLGAFVISERSSDIALDEILSKHVIFADSPDDLINKVLHYNSHPEDIYEFLANKPQLPLFSVDISKFSPTPQKAGSLPQSDEQKVSVSAQSDFVQVEVEKIDKNSEKLKLIDITDPDRELPNISIVTLTFSERFDLFKIAKRNFRMFKYPRSKIEWIIVDDSPDQNVIRSQVSNNPRIKYVWCGKDGKKTIGAKRNIGVDVATSQYIIMMDDDDYYFPYSIDAKVRLLMKNYRFGVKCVGCTDYGVYHIVDDYSCVLNTKMISEASMAFTKDLWEERHFPEDNDPLGEGYLFLKGRENAVRTMPYMFNMIAMTHGNNVTKNLRTIPENKRSKDSLFKLFDNSTQIFLLELRSKVLGERHNGRSMADKRSDGMVGTTE